MNRAVFLDRDGVLNHDPGDYTCSLEEFEVLPEVISSLKKLHRAGWKLIVITNQGGIAKGRYTADEVHSMHDYLQGLCILEGFRIDDFYFCPHHPDYSACLCRKPGSLMIEKALAKHRLHANLCVMVGDKERDILAAAGAGVRGILTETNDSWQHIAEELAEHRE
ncbi:MAG: HAD family hydrolase [Bacteroidetes bacterium]|nr:HAD family hydrolase [Bacteroidota bacterium]